MPIKLLYFGPLKDLTGTAEEELTLDNCTAARVVAYVAEKYVGTGPLLEASAVSVNLEYVDRETVIEDGSEVALIPPVSAG